MVNRQVAAFLDGPRPGPRPSRPSRTTQPTIRTRPPSPLHAPTELDLEQAGITTVIWATGVTGRFDWLPASLLDERGVPRHEDGVMALPGLFVLGLPWLRNRGSGIVYGMDRDAAAASLRHPG